MKRIIAVLFVILICCSACSSTPVSPSQDEPKNTPSSLAQSSDHNSAVSLFENTQDDCSASEAQEDASIAPDTPAISNYQGFTQEQWNELQRQKEEYGYLSEEGRAAAVFNGEIDCTEFAHLWWEHQIDSQLVYHVGVDEFESWLKELSSTSEHCNIYSFAKKFSLSLDEFVSLIETNPYIYDLETAKRRYAYFNDDNSSLIEESSAVENSSGSTQPESEADEFSDSGTNVSATPTIIDCMFYHPV